MSIQIITPIFQLSEFTDGSSGGVESGWDPPSRIAGDAELAGKQPPLDMMCRVCGGEILAVIDSECRLHQLQCMGCKAGGFLYAAKPPPRDDFYVYTIADIDGVIRYVGKGTGERYKLSNERNAFVMRMVRAGRAQQPQRIAEGLTEAEEAQAQPGPGLL